jgi:hypothetical protein
MDTTAATISDLFDGDGQRWESRLTAEGLSEACESRGGRRSEHGESVKWVFADGSSIVETGGGWDLGLNSEADCYCWDACQTEHPATGGHNPHCAHAEGDR